MKFLKIFAIAAVAAFAVSCGKDSKKESVTLDPAPFYEESTELVLPGDNLSGYDQFTFYSDGTGTARGRADQVIPSSVRPIKKKSVEYVYKTFTYTVNGATYVVVGLYDNEANFKYDAAKHTLVIETVENGKPTEITVQNVEETPNLEIDILSKLCRKWKVSAIDIHVEGGDLAQGGISGGQIFRHGNLYEIAKAIKAKGVKFDETKLEGYNITAVNFAPTGKILITFSGQNPYIGDWGINKAGKFEYDLVYGEGNDIINANAEGTITIGDGKCKLDLKGEIKGTKDYTSTVSITLVPAN
ncbi:MAG: hypothetical protein J5632_05510 [Bacteroidales bacterium]|nr:hypothetical protein [Bacteroidales bacterium]